MSLIFNKFLLTLSVVCWDEVLFLAVFLAFSLSGGKCDVLIQKAVCGSFILFALFIIIVFSQTFPLSLLLLYCLLLVFQCLLFMS